MRRNNTEDIEIFISRCLLYGVALSAAVILIGLVMFFATGKSGYPGSTFPTSPLAVFAGAAALKPYAVMLAGLFILILTPVLRVGVSVLIFLKEKDFRYVAITALVFVILIVSFLLGKVE